MVRARGSVLIIVFRIFAKIMEYCYDAVNYNTTRLFLQPILVYYGNVLGLGDSLEPKKKAELGEKYFRLCVKGSVHVVAENSPDGDVHVSVFHG